MTRPAPTTADVVRISTTSGSVSVLAEPGRTEMWSSVALVADGDGPFTIDGGSSNVRVRVPEGTDVVIGSTSGKVVANGRLGSVSALSTSGKVSVEEARSVDARSTSGRVVVGHADGDCRVVSTSGRVEVGRCGAVDVSSGSGRVVVSDAHGPVRANCISGKISVSLAGAHDVAADTVSGRIEISLPAGVAPLVVESASDIADRAAGHDCTIIARSGSGRVVVTNR